MKRIIFSLVLLAVALPLAAQMTVTVVPAPNPAGDANIVIYNSFFDRENNKSGWIYDPTSTLSPPYRDLGQTFKPATAFYLDKVIVRISPASDQAHLDACEKAPVHLDVYQFNSIVEMEAPVDTLTSQKGHLPASLVLGTSEYLQFDLVNIALQANRYYGFLLKFDSLKTKRYLELVKSEDGDYFTGGKMLYTEFNGSDGRKNITIYKWKHAGGNNNRDLHFWLKKGLASAVAEPLQPVDAVLPGMLRLEPGYPNPFNAATRVDFTLERPAPVRAVIIDLAGRVVASLHDGPLAAGRHTLRWDGSDGYGAPAPSGLYFLRLESDGRVTGRKLSLVR